jgi:hypothetical protein
MATPVRNAMLIAEARGKIRTSQLVNRLQDHSLGRNKMTATQIKATEILLRKAIPDLSSVVLQGDDDGGAITVTTEEKRAVAVNILALTFEAQEK